MPKIIWGMSLRLFPGIRLSPSNSTAC